MKTLKTKQLNVVVSWNNLRNLPPREFATIEEMERMMAILETLEDNIPEFAKLLKGETKDLQTKREKFTDEEYAKKVSDLNKRISDVESKEGEKVISVEFEDADFNTFYQFFEKSGKNWFATVQEYLTYRRDLNDTNQQPKQKDVTKDKKK
jgi:Skp family chaperone for outer membrane proteins